MYVTYLASYKLKVKLIKSLKSKMGFKPHVVCLPTPTQSHIKAMLKLAKLFHHRGFHITFVNTEFNHKRFLKSQGPNSLDGLPDFRFETIPDGLPVEGSHDNATQDVVLLCDAILKDQMLAPFRELMAKLNAGEDDIGRPPVSCVVYDNFMPFAVRVAKEIGVPAVAFFPVTTSCYMGCKQFPTLIEKGLAPLKDESYLTNGFLDKVVDWIPSMKDIRLRDLPTHFRTTNPDDILFNVTMKCTQECEEASALIFHTFDALEPNVLDALSMLNLPPIYTIGPQQLHLNQIQEDPLNNTDDKMGYSLWKEETECLEWLNSKEANSVIYVSFGSIAVMSPKHLLEFGWGLANSNVEFIWVIRPDLVVGESAIFPPEFVAETKQRGLIASWCPQEEVLNHSSVGGFLTHCGWNSMIESLCAGVPMLCWAFFADQQTNCWCACNEWGVGIEIGSDVRSDELEKLVRDLMKGEKGGELRARALEWKKLAEEAIAPNGSSSKNLENLVNQVLLQKPEGKKKGMHGSN